MTLSDSVVRRANAYAHDLRQDMSLAIRRLRHARLFAFAIVTTLAVGIATNLTMFGVFSAVLLQPLPYAQRSLVFTAFEIDEAGVPGGVSLPDLQDWQRQSTQVERFELYSAGSAAWTDSSGNVFRVKTAAVTPGFFGVFKYQPTLGSNKFDKTDIVISARVARQRYGRIDLLGAPVFIDGQLRRVVGIMGDEFDFPHTTDVWTQLDTAEELAHSSRKARFLRVVGAVHQGGSLLSAQAELSAIGSRLELEHPTTNAHVQPRIVELRESLTAPTRPTLLLLFALAGIVFLVACGNAGLLQLNQIASRRYELALRAALGANRSRLIRQLLTEVAVLATLASVIAFILAYWATGLLLKTRPVSGIPIIATSDPLRIAVFSVALAVVCVAVVSLIPLVEATSAAAQHVLKEGGSRGSAPRAGGPIILAETAFATLLLIGALLTTRSLLKLQAEPLGFDRDQVYVVSAKPPSSFVGASRLNFATAMLGSIREQPGIQNAAISNVTPMSGRRFQGHVDVVVQQGGAGGDESADWRVVSDGYFKTLRIPMRAGRDFGPTGDGLETVAEVIVNESAARRLWGNERVLGAHIAVPQLSPSTREAHRQGADTWFTVVGIAGDIREVGVGTPAQPAIYFPLNEDFANIVPDILIRSSLSAVDARRAVARAVGRVSQTVPSETVPMADLLASNLAVYRLRMTLIAVFAALALFLVVLGIYSITANVIARRRGEIGIRLALGAQHMSMLLAVVRGVAVYAFAGLAVGTAAAAALSRLGRQFLYQVDAGDPLTYLVVACGVLIIVLISSAMPASSVLRIDPASTLRSQ